MFRLVLGSVKVPIIQCTNLSGPLQGISSHIPSWEKENHGLKGALLGDVLVPRRLSYIFF